MKLWSETLQQVYQHINRQSAHVEYKLAFHTGNSRSNASYSWLISHAVNMAQKWR